MTTMIQTGFVTSEQEAAECITRECLRSLRRLIYHTRSRISRLGKTHPLRYKLLADLDQITAEYKYQKLCLYSLS